MNAVAYRKLFSRVLLLSLCLVPLSATSAEDDKKDKDKDRSNWTSLFDGKRLGKWKVVAKSDFKDHGKVTVTSNKAIQLGRGDPATGIRYAGKVPTVNYELELEARRIKGGDFFCGLTFPVGKQSLTLILGGWGGQVVGLSTINGQYAIDNETATSFPFKQNDWYRIRLKVDKETVDVSVNGKEIVYFTHPETKLKVGEEMAPCLPLGIATWKTGAEIRKVRLRKLTK